MCYFKKCLSSLIAAEEEVRVGIICVTCAKYERFPLGDPIRMFSDGLHCRRSIFKRSSDFIQLLLSELVFLFSSFIFRSSQY